jgi:hypothetical protein
MSDLWCSHNAKSSKDPFLRTCHSPSLSNTWLYFSIPVLRASLLFPNFSLFLAMNNPLPHAAQCSPGSGISSHKLCVSLLASYRPTASSRELEEDHPPVVLAADFNEVMVTPYQLTCLWVVIQTGDTWFPALRCGTAGSSPGGDLHVLAHSWRHTSCFCQHTLICKKSFCLKYLDWFLVLTLNSDLHTVLSTMLKCFYFSLVLVDCFCQSDRWESGI